MQGALAFLNHYSVGFEGGVVTIQSHASGMDGVPNHQCMQVLNRCVKQYRVFKSLDLTQINSCLIKIKNWQGRH